MIGFWRSWARAGVLGCALVAGTTALMPVAPASAGARPASRSAVTGRVSPIPANNMGYEVAATLPVALQTMHDAVVGNGRLKAGETVMIQGASSGVGLMGLQIAKLKGTYVDTLPGQIDRKTGRLHGQFDQAVAATGRLSSSNPNLQNIPMRTEQGLQIRKAFLRHVAAMLVLAGDSQDSASASAQKILAFETTLAEAALTNVQRRDPDATYHKMPWTAAAQLAPALDWPKLVKSVKLSWEGSVDVSEGLVSFIQHSSAHTWLTINRNNGAFPAAVFTVGGGGGLTASGLTLTGAQTGVTVLFGGSPSKRTLRPKNRAPSTRTASARSYRRTTSSGTWPRSGAIRCSIRRKSIASRCSGASRATATRRSASSPRTYASW